MQPQGKQFGSAYIGPYRVADLNAMSANSTVAAGTVAYATDGRAIIGINVLAILGLSQPTVQSAGAGTGVLVSYSSKTGAWQIVGWTIAVQA